MLVLRITGCVKSLLFKIFAKSISGTCAVESRLHSVRMTTVCVFLRSAVMMMGSSSRCCAAYSFFDLGVSSLIVNCKNIFYLKLKFFEKTTRNLLLSFDITYLVKVCFVIDRSH